MLEWLTRRRPIHERLVTVGLTLIAIGAVDVILLGLVDPALSDGTRAIALPAIIVGAATGAIGFLLGRSRSPNDGTKPL